ncbi:MAG: hypothetical protein JXR76_20540 [Deltaproteobacteria bacterium]|nr:hypothetical protein [Deltaproteobacteria bacterium]
MKLSRSKKPAVFLLILIFLMVGGAAAFFYVINHAADPMVEADIDAHFASLDKNIPEFTYNSFESTRADSAEVVLFSSDVKSEAKADSDTRAPQPASKRKRGRRRAKKKLNDSPTAHAHNGINKIAPGTWLISSKTVSHARNNLMDYVGSAHAELVEKEDGPVGFRLRGIKRGSYLHEVGLRSKDVLIAINGHPLNSIENVTLAVASFKSANRFRLDILRSDDKLSLYYKVVEN